MLDQIVSSSAVAILNRFLMRADWARERLAPFAGRVARFDVPPLSLNFAVADGGTFVVATGETADVTITFDATALPNLLADPQALMRNVRLSGDAEFAQALSQVLQELRPEPEEELSRFVGDAAAVRLVAFLRAAAEQIRQGAERLSASAADYFVAENPMLVSRSEADAFAREVARLRDDVERLTKRIERIGDK